LVAGVAALIKSRYPNLAPDLVARAMTSTTTNRPAKSYDSQIGFGIVDATAAMAEAGKLASAGKPAGAGGQPAAAAGVSAASHFGGGPAANLAGPVRPRGKGPLLLFAVLAVTCLVLAAAAATRLVVLRRPRP
jgi:hypothetical protein